MGLLLAMLLSAPGSIQLQPEPDCNRQGERCQQRGNRNGRTGSLAFFEFAPLSGAGMGSSCPLPNWALQSEAFDSASWAKQAVVVAVPTVTANQIANPVDGAVNADRVQIPAFTGPAQFSRISQIISGLGLPGGTATCSVWVRGNGMSGSFPLFFLTSFPSQTSTCSFTSGVWSQCSLTGTLSAASEVFYLGESGSNANSPSAQDFFLWGAQCNVGSTRAPYIATTTAAMGQAVTGARGESLTFTRGSTATCTKGSPTSGIANGDLVVMPSNQVRVGNPDGLGLALLVESSRQNVAIQSQSLDNVAWTYGNVASSNPTLNGTDVAVAPDGTTTAEDITFAAISAGQASYVFGNFDTTCASTMCSASVYVKGQSGSGTMDICLQSGGAACANCAFNSSTWTRCSVSSAAITGTPFLTIGNVGNFAPTHARSSNRVFVWGAQRELGAYATSYIPTTTVAVTRAADGPTRYDFGAASPMTGTLISMAATGIRLGATTSSFAQMLVVSNDQFASVSGRGMWMYSAGTSGSDIKCLAGNDAAALYATGVVSWGATTGRGWCSGSGITNGNYNGNAMSPSAAHTGTWTAARYLGIGGDPISNVMDGYIRQVCVDPSPARCR